MTNFVQVALPLPLFQTFTYGFEGSPPPSGTRVLVPFRRSVQVGWVVGQGDPTGIEGIRPILDVLEQTLSVPEELLRLALWISEYYVVPPGIAIRAMLPPVLSDGSTEVLRLTPEGRGWLGDGRRRQILEAVGARGGQVPVAALRGLMGKRSIWPEIRALTGEGLLEHETLPPPEPPIKTRKVVRMIEWLSDLRVREECFGRARRQRECYEAIEAAGGAFELAILEREHGFSRTVVRALEEKGLARVQDEEVLRDPFQGGAPLPPVDQLLTGAQERALGALVEAARAPSAGSPFLLRGVTGSGKTLVYIRLLQEVITRLGRSAIVLVPEISLTPQTVGRFRSWFGDEVAVLHSGLSQGERFDQWRLIRRGERRLVVGARSAVFAPVPHLGAIVVDEEHDSSYKQSEAPRYHGRDVAVYRAALAGAVCVLGTATPALESWMNVTKGKFRLLTLPERVGGRRLPPVEIVDLRRLRGKPEGGAEEGRAPEGRATEGRDRKAKPDEGSGILSPRLVSAVRDRLQKGEQCILLLNRRGYSSFVQCRECGVVRECPNCSVSLTLHRARGRLLCHHCGHDEPRPERCASCGSTDLSFRGLGTEQVERVVAETFPGARIARMDQDTTSGRWSHHEILGRVERGEVDLLLGTQMIAKGLDFPRVTLVGVVNADVGIHLPDFRATERSFQLLSQVAGRAGRGDLGGEVIIQSSIPDHYAIQAAVSHDVEGFLAREIEERRTPLYPPHVRLVNVVVSSPDRARVADAVEAAAAWLRGRVGKGETRGLELVGPAPSPIERLHGRWRWHFFLRGGAVGPMSRLLRQFEEGFRPPAGDVRIVVDRDPVAML
ncbi:MAG: primosomal protein N' [Gemmatimonadetes bacterium]|nr:primosomal protein N' [Gemmatimonadota bacterium]